MDNHPKNIFILSSRSIYRRLSLLFFLLSIIAVILLQSIYYNRTYNEKDLSEFEQVLHSKESRLEDVFDKLMKEDKSDSILIDVLDRNSEMLIRLSEKEDLYVYYYENMRLKYWSDNSVPLRERWIQRMRKPVYQTNNATYLTKFREEGEGILFGLILIRKEYQFENDYLESGYQKDFQIDREISMSRQTGPGLADVFSENGGYLFSLDLYSRVKMNPVLVNVSLLLFNISIVLLFLFFVLKTDSILSGKSRFIWLVSSIASILAISIMVVWFDYPKILFEAGFFTPEVYASMRFPSLGHLYLFVLFVLMIVLLIYWFASRGGTHSGLYRRIMAVVYLTFASGWFLFNHYLITTLVLDSTISFESYKLDTLNPFTFLGLIIILMSILVFMLLVYKSLGFISGRIIKRRNLLLFLPGLLVQLLYLFFKDWHVVLFVPLFYILIIGSLIYLKRSAPSPKFSRFFIVILVLSAFLTIDLQHHMSEKLNSIAEVELAKLSSEHDAVAEMLFADMTEQLHSDSALISRLSYPIIEIDLLYEYLQRIYFSGYWTKYDLQITLCGPSDSVMVENPDEYWYPCYDFFSAMVGEEGMNVEDSDFYFLDNQNGRISYLGKISYDIRGDELTIFLELNSKIISEELGYPSLLMRENRELESKLSYARYYGGNLITSHGEYNYRLEPDYYTAREARYEHFRSEGYDHAIFNSDNETTVIVSMPVVSIIDNLISFSYMFAFVFVLFALAYLIGYSPHIRAKVTWDFKNKIQYSVIGVLFLTFVVICAGTIYFVIQQYRIKHNDNMDNTMRSLYIELVHKVEYEQDLRNWSSEDYYNLDELLRKFSNIFNTDINMYDEEGMLLATSRGEIFEQGLLGERMNREAYDRLSEQKYSSFTHTESIGKMRYQSSYIPLLNNESKFLAYLNLPYFTQPEILAQEVSNLVVAILNTYVILLLLILSLSVFLADRITQPLRIIQSRIAQLSLSKKNEKIVYEGKDEIAGLVNEYNYMVDELSRSAELLAQSERETAWREMAKQIAHEIKNPLTPMKLNIQHMLRMMEEGEGDIRQRVVDVSHSLIKQIDLLSSIANEFSDFAKIPRARRKKIDVIHLLRNVMELFVNTEGLSIELKDNGIEEMNIMGDAEQFQRVIINLVKNGIQSVPENRKKIIKISVEQTSDGNGIISVSDNGRGIPDAIKDKLFQPNFTTKTGGMGMGLAISASIIKSIGGSITYESNTHEGTTFIISLPLLKQQQGGIH